MKAKSTLMRAACIVAATLSCFGAEQAASQRLVEYDRFRGVRIQGVPGKHLDPDLWDAWQTRGALEVRRYIQGRYAVLSSTTYGQADSDSGVRFGRSVLPFPESVGAQLTAIEATFQMTRAAIEDYPTNPDRSDGGRVRSRIIGIFSSATQIQARALRRTT